MNSKSHPTNKTHGKCKTTVNLTPAQSRPMQGMDQKSFKLNDIVPITISNPSNDQQLVVTISCDANGYTWLVQGQGGGVVATGTALYGSVAKQFDVQAMFYKQYYNHSVELDLQVTQGGAVYALSPIVTLLNPAGQDPFQFGSGTNAFQELISSPMNTSIHNPYQVNRQKLDYSKYMVSNSTRAWRQTIAIGSTTRELYPTDSFTSEPDQNQCLPSMVRAYAVTIPNGTFQASAGTFVLGLLKISTRYMFSQRRTNIEDLVVQRRKEIQDHEKEEILEKLKSLSG